MLRLDARLAFALVVSLQHGVVIIVVFDLFCLAMQPLFDEQIEILQCWLLLLRWLVVIVVGDVHSDRILDTRKVMRQS